MRSSTNTTTLTRLANYLGAVELTLRVFKRRHASPTPEATLLINDFDLSPAYGLSSGCLSVDAPSTPSTCRRTSIRATVAPSI